ncbi:MAG: hypothetical protein J6T98_13285 [Salinivirgaceae bacterium]|nr:hypothetical protein [Salinivirgaceae bacterium]
MSLVEDFISNLSWRFNSENNLSDITWTMCQTSDIFLDSFLHFFFPDDEFGEIYLQRELSDEDCRPDFYFECEGETFLIECKIWDQNHHFEQYTKHFKIQNDKLGYITNYPMIKKGYTVRTWTELYLYLQKHIPKDEESLWNGYLEYLKQVCVIFIPQKPMNTDGMFSLYTFYRSLDEVFVVDNEKYTASIYKSKIDTNNGGNIFGTPRDGIMGKYFEVKFKHIRLKQTWGWMGVYFERENPLICIAFDYREGWGKPVYDLLLDKVDNLKNGKLYNKPYEEEGAIWFDFRQKDKFNSLTIPSKQISLLKSYFQEVLDTIYKIKQEL